MSSNSATTSACSCSPARARRGRPAWISRSTFARPRRTGSRGTRKAQREVLWLVAAPALVPEADHRHGQWLVLRRRLWAAVRLRPRLRRRGGAIRPLGDQLGHPSGRRRDQGRARAHDVSQCHVSRADRRDDRRPQGGRMGLRQRGRSAGQAQGARRGGRQGAARQRTRSRSRRRRTPSAASAK